ncbi:MAG: glycosyltransferase family 4 protein [Candidatus Omnitrophica bacterium]|nr:glycosyltransferase family 4 protein [Candidatus Omnitrophota bacterium]
MRIGIDAREIQNGVFTGIGRALYNFLHYFDRGIHNDCCFVFSTKPLPFHFSDKIVNVVMEEVTTFIWDQVQLPWSVREKNIEIFYSPYYKLPLFGAEKKVCAVLDVMYLTFPEYERQMGLPLWLYYQVLGREYLKAAAKILTCSYFSKEDIIRIWDVDPRKIEVIPLSVSDVYRPDESLAVIEAVRARFDLRGRYILYVGNFKMHKDVMTLCRAFEMLSEKDKELKLVLVAPLKDGYAAMHAWLADKGLLGRVLFTGAITDEGTLRTLYSAAEVFVMPSLSEGFGLPPVEAMACGTPVVSSHAASLPEVVGNAGILIAPGQPEVMAQAVGRILEDQTFRQDLVIRGLKHVEQYREARIGKRMFDFFKNLAG